jgi:hypothetical protein
MIRLEKFVYLKDRNHVLRRVLPIVFTRFLNV